MNDFNLKILQNTLETYATIAENKGADSFVIKLTVQDAVELSRLVKEEKGELILVGEDTWACSRCRKQYGYKPNYCSNCGAYLGGEDDA